MSLRSWIQLLAIATLTACGGGGGSSPGVGTGTVSIALTDAPATQYDHVWITVREVWFHTSSTADNTDSGWLKFLPPAPETFDLLALANGNMASAFSGLTLPAGSYQQIRLFLVPPGAPLVASAQTAGLAYNDEVAYTDSGGSQTAPLEIANPVIGMRLTGTFDVAQGKNLALAIDFDADNDVLQFNAGTATAFVLKPRLAYFDLASVGAIVGQVDPSALLSPSNSGGAANLVVKAESLSSDGTYHVIHRITTVKADGSFVLYPLRVPAASTSTTYDVVIRGLNMQTLILKGIPVNVGTTPALNPTAIQVDPIALTTGSDYTANENSSQPMTPTAALVLFYQTLPLTGEVPYAVRLRQTNPFTGMFFQDIPLSAGPIEYGSYNGGSDIVLTAVNPTEGVGSFQVFGRADDYDRTAGGVITAASAQASNPETFTIPALAVSSPAVADSIGGIFTQTTAGKYDQGFLVVTHAGDIVTTLPLAPVLAQNGGAGGPYSIGNLPGGSTSQSFAEGRYRLTARVWNSSDPKGTAHLEFYDWIVDLRSGSATSVNLAVN